MTAYRWYNMPFAAPYMVGHCVPLAFTYVQRKPTARFAIDLADTAYFQRTRLGKPLLTHRGSAQPRQDEAWAALAHLTIVDYYEPKLAYEETTFVDSWGSERRRVRSIGAPTVAQFARTHRTGRWIVYTLDHAQAVVNGKIIGWVAPRRRVRRAVRVLPQEET